MQVVSARFVRRTERSIIYTGLSQPPDGAYLVKVESISMRQDEPRSGGWSRAAKVTEAGRSRSGGAEAVAMMGCYVVASKDAWYVLKRETKKRFGARSAQSGHSRYISHKTRVI